MPDGFPIQTNFTSGEISPLLRGRVDIAKYFNGVGKLRNFLVKPQGGIVRRSGTRYVNSAKDDNKLAIAVRFEFSKTQAFILIFGPTYIRVIKDGGYILSAGIPVEIITPYAEADLRGLYFAQSADVLYICHPSYAPRTLSRISDTNWVLAAFTTLDGPYLDLDANGYMMSLTSISNRATITSTANDFGAGDVNKFVEYSYKTQRVIGQIKTFISATQVTIEPLDERVVDTSGFDNRAVLEFTSSNGGSTWTPRIRSSVAIWTKDMEDKYIKVSGSWYHTITHLVQPEAVNYTPGGVVSQDIMTAGVITMVTPTGVLSFKNQAITATLTSTDNVFASTDVGRLFRLDFNSQQVWGTITAYTDAKNVSVNLGRMMPPDPSKHFTYLNNAQTLFWRLGAWYTANYPSSVVFHEERLTFAATPLQPQTVWMSKSADYDNFAPTDKNSVVTDDSAITYTIASGEINSIVWMQSSAVLLIGTIGGEWQTKASTISEPLTPTNIAVVEQTPYGSHTTARPQKVGSSIIFPQRTGAKLRELVYDFQSDSYVAKDLTIVSEHILKDRSGSLATAYQKDPDSILWVATSAGSVIGLTYEKDQEVFAWHVHELGGTGVSVLSVASIPATDGKSDVLYMVVRRTINGSPKTYIEYMEVDHSPTSNTDTTGMFFVDCGLSYSGVAVGSVSGLSHLEGETVQVLADGTQRNNATVSAGAIAVSGTAATKIHVGLPFSSICTVLPLESGSASGTAQGKIKRIQRLIMRLQNSMTFKLGLDESTLKQVGFANNNLYTDDKVIDMVQDYGLQSCYTFVQDKPLPLKVLALMPQMQTNI